MSEKNEAWRQEARAAAEANPHVAPADVLMSQRQIDLIMSLKPIEGVSGDLGESKYPDDFIAAEYEVVQPEISAADVTIDPLGWHIKPKVVESWGTKHDAVNHPKHYTDGQIEVWDFISDKNLNFLLGNVIKYVCRAGKKSDLTYLEDLRKAEAYLQREIKRITDNAAHH